MLAGVAVRRSQSAQSGHGPLAAPLDVDGRHGAAHCACLPGHMGFLEEASEHYGSAHPYPSAKPESWPHH